MLYVSDVITENGPVPHFWGFVFLSKDPIKDYFLIWVVILIWHCVIHHCLGINNISLFYSFLYIVSLFFSQTHGLFVLDVIDFFHLSFLLMAKMRWYHSCLLQV